MITWLRRRVLPLLLVVAMVASYLPMSAFAEGEDTKTLEVQVGQELSYKNIADNLGLTLFTANGAGKIYKIYDNSGTCVFPETSINDNGNLLALGALVSLFGQKTAFSSGSSYSVQVGDLNITYKSTIFGDVPTGYEIAWSEERIPVNIYSLLNVSVTGLEGSDTADVTVNGESNLSGIKLFEGESAQIKVPDVEGYSFTVTGATPVEGTTDTYQVDFANTPDTTVTVNYAKMTDAVVTVDSGSPVSVNYGGTDFAANTSFNVPGETEFSVTIAAPANQYVSSVALDGKEASSLDYVGNGTYTATLTAGAAGAAQTLSVTCAPVLTLASDPLSVPYIDGVTTVDQVKDSILGNVMPEELRNSVSIEVQKTVLFVPRWVALDGNLDAFASGSKLRLTFAGNDQYPAGQIEVSYTTDDNRPKPVIEVENPTVEMTYGETMDKDAFLAKLGNITVSVDGQPIEGAEVSLDESALEKLTVGENTIELTYEGDSALYQPAEPYPITVNVNKADAKVSVGSKVAKYGETVNASQLITVTPADAKHIDVAVGFGLNDNDETGAVAYVDLPIDLDELLGDNIFSDVVKNIIESVLNEINGKSMSISELSSKLNELLGAIQDVQQWVDLGIDTSSVDTLINLLNQVQDLDMQVTVNVTLNQGIQLTNSGAYLVAGIVSDPNYNQSVNLGTVIIAPNAERVKLAFDYEISNGVITPALVNSEDVSMGAHVEGIDLEDELNTKVSSIFFGVQENNIYIENEPSSELGAYTQLSYLKDFGNEMSYALPIARAYVVMPDNAKITFTPAEGSFIYDGQAHGLTATVTDNNGAVISGAVAKLYYTGIQSNGALYYSENAPTESGYYTVVAAYVSADKSVAGAAVTTLTIQPAASSISVDDKVVTYNGEAVDINSLIHKTPDEADVAIMMAGLNVAGGDWSSITGVVNIDLPDYVDEVLKDIVPDAYADGLNLASVQQKVAELQQTMTDAGLDASYLDGLVSLLDKLPDAVTVTLKAQSEVNPTDMGAYLISASVFDPNYEFKTDTGVVVITPDVTKAELNWNTDIAGGVVTATMVNNGFDFSAVATVNGEENEEYTDKIQYLYIGLTADGKSVCTSNVSELTNGAYTQIAYILDNQGTAIDVAKPIVRAFVIAPENVKVNLLDQDGNVNNDQSYAYDGTEKAVRVSVTDQNGAVIDTSAGTLSVSYTGVDSLGRFYSSTTAPTQTGYYTVFASYVEKDENGQLVRVGATMGKLTINAGEAIFDLKDKTVRYDGKQKSVDVYNPKDLDFIMVITDKDNNVNVIFPESWNIPAARYDVSGAVQKVLDQLGKLPAPIQERSGSEIVSKLGDILKSIDIKTLQINGAYPVKVGAYQFSAVAFSANYQPVTDTATLVIKKAPTPPSGGDDNDNDNNNNGNNNNNNSTTNNNTQNNKVTVNNGAAAQTQTQAAEVIPQTGDSMPVGLLSGLAIVAAAAFVVLLVIRKRKHNS